MKKYLCTLILTIGLIGIAYAQNTSIPNQIADVGVSDAKTKMDQDNDTIRNLTMQDAADSTIISNAQNDLSQRQQAILALAIQTVPLPSAVALCNSNPSAYCPGWSMINSPSQVNWDEVATLRAQGVNWSTIDLTMDNVNWPSVNQANGINWSNINIVGINWTDWYYQEKQGVNWSQWILGGGQ